MTRYTFLAVTLTLEGSTKPIPLAAGRFLSPDELVSACLRCLHGLPRQNYTNARIVAEPLVRQKDEARSPGRWVRREDSIYDVLHKEVGRFFDVPT